MSSKKYEYIGQHYVNALVYKSKEYDPKKMTTKEIEELMEAEPHTQTWFKKKSGSSSSSAAES